MGLGGALGVPLASIVYPPQTRTTRSLSQAHTVAARGTQSAPPSPIPPAAARAMDE